MSQRERYQVELVNGRLRIAASGTRTPFSYRLWTRWARRRSPLTISPNSRSTKPRRVDDFRGAADAAGGPFAWQYGTADGGVWPGRMV
jgi:hypothetical protein